MSAERPLYRIGVSPSNYERWCDAVPKIAMCLAEAGFPTEIVAVDRLSFARTPPESLVAKAAELCGISDLLPADKPIFTAPSGVTGTPKEPQ